MSIMVMKINKYMKKFRIHYSFDGDGYVDIEAESLTKANQKWDDGDYCDEVESGQNYVIEKITLNK